MIQDAWTVGRQEWRNIRRSLMPSAGDVITFALVLGLFGLVIPISLTGGWLSTTGFFFLWFWLVWLIVAGPISDAFAGEHERATLDALFATRLPDAAILLGKIAAVTLFAWALTLLALLASAAIVLLSGAGMQGASVHPVYLAVAAALTPFACLLSSATGALLSLNARSARQAHQATIAIAPAIALAVLAANRAVMAVAPSLAARLHDALPALATSPYLWLAAAAILLCTTAIVYAVAAARLHRSRVVPA